MRAAVGRVRRVAPGQGDRPRARRRARSSTRCLSNDLDTHRPRPARSTRCACDESGGVVDDLIAYLIGEDEAFLVPNASNTAEVVAAARPRPRRTAITGVAGQHRDFGVLAVQGPRSAGRARARLGLPARARPT